MDEQPLALIVEDNEDLSFIFGEALREAGYQIELIRDGQEAAGYLETNHPLVVILDLHLPGIAGTEILKQIRASDHLKDVRVVVTTADARLAEQLNQADFVLIKPISFSLLRDLTSRLSEGKSAVA